MPYCGPCEATQPVVSLVWCAFCEAFHDYGKATPVLGVEKETIRICLACGSVLPDDASDPEEEAVPLTNSEDSE